MMDRSRLLEAAAATVVAELAFSRSDRVDITVVTPLVHRDDVVMALPYADRLLADALHEARTVVLVSSDERLTLPGWRPMAVWGRIEVEPDLDGARFRAHLVEEELRKYPPARLLADSLRDRRDHWWYLPRLWCRLVDIGEVQPVAPRKDSATGVAAWEATDGLRADTVACEGATDVHLRSLAGAPLRGAGDPACLLRHDFSIPDLECRTALVERGRLEGDRLRVTEREGTLEVPEPLSLLTRIRRHRAFARACRRELARARAEQP